ncbi:MAG: phage tail protein [Chloroflexi bacterium]|nr:MAG: phage tail protein [Chloroflexota bacterium]
MTRGFVPGLASPHPLGERLPAMYLEDSLVQRMTGAFDDILAPIFSSLDNLDAYVDPDLAPEHFLLWLGDWVGLALDESWPVERRRAVVAAAAGLYRVRGTARGLAAYLQILTGANVEIEETGGTVYSTGSRVDPTRLEALVRTAKPAHVVHRIEVVAAAT